MKQRIKDKFQKATFKVKTVFAMATLYMVWPTLVLADETEPVIVSGTRKLLAAGTAILTGFIVGVAVFNAYKIGITWMNADTEEKPKYKKQFIGVIIIAVITLTAGSTITWIVGFYQG